MRSLEKVDAEIKHPGCKTEAEFAPKLKEVDYYIANKAGEIVEKHMELILELCNFLLEKRLAAPKVRNRPPEKFSLSRDEIDSFPPVKQRSPRIWDGRPRTERGTSAR